MTRQQHAARRAIVRDDMAGINRLHRWLELMEKGRDVVLLALIIAAIASAFWIGGRVQ